MASAALPSSSAARRRGYDVFLSFEGRETGKGFTSELYRRLSKRGIKTYMDDPNNQVGAFISSTLDERIKGSSLAIIILSPHYASSTLCLQELTKICQCMDDRIRPLFYDQTYVERRFTETFLTYENSGMYKSEKLREWQDALETVYKCSTSGWNLKDYKTERALVKKTVEDIYWLVQEIKNNRVEDIYQLTQDIKNNQRDDPGKKVLFGSTSNANLGKQHDLIKGGKFDRENCIVIENRCDLRGEVIIGDRGGDGGNSSKSGIAGTGGPGKGNNNITYGSK